MKNLRNININSMTSNPKMVKFNSKKNSIHLFNKLGFNNSDYMNIEKIDSEFLSDMSNDIIFHPKYTSEFDKDCDIPSFIVSECVSSTRHVPTFINSVKEGLDKKFKSNNQVHKSLHKKEELKLPPSQRSYQIIKSGEDILSLSRDNREDARELSSHEDQEELKDQVSLQLPDLPIRRNSRSLSQFNKSTNDHFNVQKARKVTMKVKKSANFELLSSSQELVRVNMIAKRLNSNDKPEDLSHHFSKISSIQKSSVIQSRDISKISSFMSPI